MMAESSKSAMESSLPVTGIGFMILAVAFTLPDIKQSG
jgi:hypothetical protein